MKRWRSVGVVLLMLVGGTVVPVSAFGESPGGSSAAPGRGSQASLTYRDADLGLEVDMEPGPNGSAVVRVTAGPLSVVKTLRSDGTTARVISVGQDTVRITNDAAGVVVERDGRRASWRAGEVSETAVEAVRAVLSGSPAIRVLRRLGTVIERRASEDSAFVMSILMDHAFVGLLDGDELAVHRLGKRVAERARVRSRRNAGEGLVPVSLTGRSLVTLGPFRDCLGELYGYVGRSWGQYEQCFEWAMADPWYQRGLHIMWCQREFEIRMASGLLQFVDCSMSSD